MAYVEFLRAIRALKIIGWAVLGFVVLAIVLRIAFNDQLSSHDKLLQRVRTDPGVVTTHSKTLDGADRTVYTDPDGTVVTYDDYGYGGARIRIEEPSHHSHSNDAVVVGNVTINSHAVANKEVTEIDTTQAVPAYMFLTIGSFFALILGTMLGAPFARENDGHLEYAFTKPVSRVVLALQMIGIDCAAIFAGMIGTAIVFVGILALFTAPHLSFEAIGPHLVNAVGVTFAWYGLIAAATASMRRGYGVIVGMSWPVLLGVGALATASFGDAPIAVAIRNVFRTLHTVSPLKYWHGGANLNFSDNGTVPMHLAPSTGEMLIPLVLFAVYAAASIIQWRRVQA